MARALDLHSRGQGFDSLILHVFFGHHNEPAVKSRSEGVREKERRGERETRRRGEKREEKKHTRSFKR